MKNKLLIIGASGHGKVVADVAIKMKKWNLISFLDDNPKLKSVMGFRVVGNSIDMVNFIDEWDIFVAIGNNLTRKRIIEKLESLSASIPVLIHPSAIIGNRVNLKVGTVVMAGAIINCCTYIGKGCIINTGASVDHDNCIGNYVHLSPGTKLAGDVTIGNNSWIGIGGVIKNNLTIASNCVVGAGSLIINNITEAGTYVGVPVKRIK